MRSKSDRNSLTLIGLDIRGDWNIPLLKNAAESSGASMVLAQTNALDDTAISAESHAALYEVLDQYEHLIACETGRGSRSIYALPCPRGRTAVVVGNETTGVSTAALKRAHRIVSVPMRGKGMTSLNVAVAGAVVLYVLERDLARSGTRKSRLTCADVDLLIQGSDDPSELGSLLRSAWAFGWRKLYLSDPHSVWFTDDRATALAGRAAARREINPLVVAPDDLLDRSKYRSIILCSHDRSGTPLSRFALPDQGPVLIVLGEREVDRRGSARRIKVRVDHRNSRTDPRFRHSGSILLSVISEMLRGGRRG